MRLSLLVVGFAAVYAAMYGLHQNTKRGISKLVTALSIFLLTLLFVLTAKFEDVPFYVFMPSFVAWVMLFNERKKIIFGSLVHIVAALLVFNFGTVGTIAAPHLPLAFLAATANAFCMAAIFDVRANERYYSKCHAMVALLERNEVALEAEMAQARSQAIKLSRAQASLQHQVEENSSRLATLKGVNSERASLARAASSDLKQPLRTIGSFIQLIGRKLTRLGLADEMAEYQTFISDGVARMNAMVDDLLKYSDYQADQDSLELLDPNAILAHISDNLTDLLRRENARIEVKPNLPTILGQRTQVLQLFQNLISNGIKFKRAGVHPVCTVGCNVGDQVAEFYVSDNGIGMPQDRLKDVFGLFTRLHERGSYEGTGIGLALCRRIVLAAGGEIWAESTEGEGTTFRFTWPLEAAPQAMEPLSKALAI